MTRVIRTPRHPPRAAALALAVVLAALLATLPTALAIGSAPAVACERDRGALAALAESAWPAFGGAGPDCGSFDPSTAGLAPVEEPGEPVATPAASPAATPAASPSATPARRAGAIARLEAYAPGERFRGTAFHVGAGLWVSAAHVVEGATGGRLILDDGRVAGFTAGWEIHPGGRDLLVLWTEPGLADTLDLAAPPAGTRELDCSAVDQRDRGCDLDAGEWIPIAGEYERGQSGSPWLPLSGDVARGVLFAAVEWEGSPAGAVISACALGEWRAELRVSGCATDAASPPATAPPVGPLIPGTTIPIAPRGEICPDEHVRRTWREYRDANDSTRFVYACDDASCFLAAARTLGYSCLNIIGGSWVRRSYGYADGLSHFLPDDAGGPETCQTWCERGDPAQRGYCILPESLSE